MMSASLNKSPNQTPAISVSADWPPPPASLNKLGMSPILSVSFSPTQPFDDQSDLQKQEVREAMDKRLVSRTILHRGDNLPTFDLGTSGHSFEVNHY